MSKLRIRSDLLVTDKGCPFSLPVVLKVRVISLHHPGSESISSGSCFDQLFYIPDRSAFSAVRLLSQRLTRERYNLRGSLLPVNKISQFQSMVHDVNLRRLIHCYYLCAARPKHVLQPLAQERRFAKSSHQEQVLEIVENRLVSSILMQMVYNLRTFTFRPDNSFRQLSMVRAATSSNVPPTSFFVRESLPLRILCALSLSLLRPK